MSSEPGDFSKKIGDVTRTIRARLEPLMKLEPAAAAEWATNFFQRQNANFYGKLLAIFLCSYFLADLTAILASRYLPEPSQGRNRYGFGMRRAPQIDDYNIIMTRNLVNSKGIIPGEEVGNVEMATGTPVKTSLPFNLIGTMILSDEHLSVATIEDKGGNQVYPVREEDEIPQKAKIQKIEARRVIFVNMQNHRREFVEMPEGENPNLPRITLGTKPPQAGGGIEQVASGQYVISRTEVDKALSDLNNILTQARAVPNFENGQPAGYKLFQIVPGSIYQKLGIQEGDVICGFDGQPANDPAAAFEKLSNLKNTSHLDLCIKRSGKQQTYSYDFR